MRRLLLCWTLLTGLAGLGAQVPEWGRIPPAEAEASALSLGKPVLLLWQAGPGAPGFTQETDRLFSSWPDWTRQAALSAVFTRGRAWDAPLPPSFPGLPEGGRQSCLVLWVPGSPLAPSVWLTPPPVLELSHRLAEVSGRPLADPYQVGVRAYAWDDWTLTRVDSGPRWSAVGPEGTSDWVEEGPLGTVLILAELSTGRRAAFPLEGEWSFLYDPDAQSWAAWNPVLVKRP